MISQRPISSSPLSFIGRGGRKVFYFIFNECREVVVPFESRIVEVPFESRQIVIEFEPRTVSVPFENRTVKISC